MPCFISIFSCRAARCRSIISCFLRIYRFFIALYTGNRVLLVGGKLLGGGGGGLMHVGKCSSDSVEVKSLLGSGRDSSEGTVSLFGETERDEERAFVASDIEFGFGEEKDDCLELSVFFLVLDAMGLASGSGRLLDL